MIIFELTSACGNQNPAMRRGRDVLLNGRLINRDETGVDQGTQFTHIPTLYSFQNVLEHCQVVFELSFHLFFDDVLVELYQVDYSCLHG